MVPVRTGSNELFSSSPLSVRRDSVEPSIALTSVPDFLAALNLSHFEEKFRVQEIDVDIIRTLTDADLEKIGVDTLGARKKILKALERARPVDSKTCVICFEKDVETAFIPCAHSVACVGCSEKIMNTTGCPLCRSSISQVLKLFKA